MGRQKKTARKPSAKQLEALKRGKGRPPGRRNKVTIEAKAAMNEIVDNPAYRKALEARMVNGTAGAMEPICWYYAKGKPKERVELGADKSLAYLIAEAAGALPKDGGE